MEVATLSKNVGFTYTSNFYSHPVLILQLNRYHSNIDELRLCNLFIELVSQNHNNGNRDKYLICLQSQVVGVGSSWK
jgi:hypothetical protein